MNITGNIRATPVLLLSTLAAAGVFASRAVAQNVVTTVAGTEWLFPGDGRRAVDAPLGGVFVLGIAVDTHGAYYIADEDNEMVFKVTPDGILRVVAGNGINAHTGDGGPATAAAIGAPQGVAVDANDNLIVLDGLSYIRKVTPDGIISTVAGDGTYGFTGDGGPATLATFNSPYGIAVDSAGSIYIADRDNNRIRKITPDGIINTIAGNGNAAYKGDGGPATSASLNAPLGIAVDGAGNVYIADSENDVIRMVSPQGIITTVVGGGPLSVADGVPAANAAIIPSAIAVDGAGNLIISDFNTNRVRVVINGLIYTIAGNGEASFSGDGGPGNAASLNNPTGVAFDPVGGIYIGDSDNRRVRRVGFDGLIQTVAGNGQFRYSGEGLPATSSTLYLPFAVALDKAGNLYIVEPEQARVRKVAPNGILSTFAGNGDQGYDGDGKQATASRLWFPAGVAVDKAGSVYIADEINSRIRKVTPDGIISTFAGTGRFDYTGDNGPATAATFYGPQSLAFDSGGNLYVGDVYNNAIRKITPPGIISTYAGNGTAGNSGNGGPAAKATLNTPSGLAFDAQDNLYIADSGNNTVRKVTPQGIISTVAGTGKAGFGGDGKAATAALLSQPEGVLADAAGNLYIGDSLNHRIRKVTPDGIISTLAGSGSGPFSGDGGPAAQAGLSAALSFAMDSAGDLIFADWINHRVRAILTTPPAFQFSPGALSFSAESGGVPAPAQTIQLAGSIPGIPFADAVVLQNTPAWLQVTPGGGFLPAGAQVTADPAALAPGTYRATVNFQAPYARPPTGAVAVTFTVSTARPSKLGAKPDALAFSLVQGAPPVSQPLSISNQGGGSLDFSVDAETISGGSWLAISLSSGSATPVNSPVITVTADPSGLVAGTYSGALTVGSRTTGETITIPTVLTISPAQQTIRLLQTGFTFTAVAGGAVTPAQNVGVQNAGQGVMNWSASTSVLSGASNWLSVTPDSGSSDASSSDTPAAQVSADPTGLAPGAYYGQVSIVSPGADNSPQTVSAVLNVLPAGSNPGPIVQPSGLIFTGVAGAESPGSQTIAVSNLSSAALTFTSAATTRDGAAWFIYLPPAGTIAPQQSTRLVVQPALDGLAPGVYRGSITLLYSGGGSSAVSILLVVVGTSAAKSNRRAEACVATQLFPVITSMGDSFAAAASWPNPLDVQVVDDCGGPMVSGSVVATFSNGDPPRVLNHLSASAWSGTWQPHTVPATPVTVTVNAQIPELSLKGLAQVTGGLRSNLAVPVINSGAVMSSASQIQQSPIAPGSLISILGSSLADSTATASALPLQTTLAGTSVLIAGSAAPVLSVSSGRIDVLVPYGVPPNTRQQVIVQKGVIATAPEPVTVAPAQPAIFTQDKSGAGQASVFAVQPDGSETLADSSHPAAAGDIIVIQCAGLGAVNPGLIDGSPAPDSPMSATVNPVTVSIGGVDAPVSFAGLVPGAAGLYQVKATMPAGVDAGDAVPIVLNVAGQSSPPVTIAVR